MTTYSLMDGVAGRPGVGSSGTQPPTSPQAYTGPFQACLIFACSKPMWFQGYRWWVPPGGDTAPQKFCLYASTFQFVSSRAQIFTMSIVPGTTVTSGTLTAGAFNFVPLPTPVNLSSGNVGQFCGGEFLAVTAWEVVNGFSDTLNQFGTGDPYVNGITNGPLSTYGQGTGNGLSGISPYSGESVAGITFATSATDPTAAQPPLTTDSTFDNFWLDVQVSDTAPAGYSGPYQLFPNRGDGNAITQPDSAIDYVIATEFHLSEPGTIGEIWYYSPSGTAQLATRASIWSITGANAGTELIAVASPSWSGLAGTGWVSCSTGSATVLPAGKYKVSVFNNAVTPDAWSCKDSTTNWWGTGEGASGITNGPLSAPALSSASLAFEYNGVAGGTPPYSNGLTEAGQCTFAQTTTSTNVYPYLYVDGLAQQYWLDIQFTPSAAPPAPAAPVAATVGDENRTALRKLRWFT